MAQEPVVLHRVILDIDLAGLNCRSMSTPSAPYYYKESGSDAYHWEKSCHKNKHPAAGWKKTNTQPSGREQCNTCKGK